MRGATLDANFAPARPSPAWLKRLGHTGARLVAQPVPAFYAYAERLNQAGIGVAVVLTGSSFVSEHYGAEALDYRDSLSFSPVLWAIGNEWNIDGAASWPVGDDAFVSLWNEVAPALAQDNPDAPVYIGGMFSEPGLLEHLKRILDRLAVRPKGVDLHLYLDDVATIAVICDEVRLMDLEPAMLEWNWNDPTQIGPFEALLEQITEHSCWCPFTRAQTATEPQPLPGLVNGTRLTNLGRAYSASLRRTR